MHFPPTSVSVALLFASSALAAAVTRNDPHQADFRTFGVAGCSEDNQGVYTLTHANVGTCKPFTAPIGSMSVTNNLCKRKSLLSYDCQHHAIEPLHRIQV